MVKQLLVLAFGVASTPVFSQSQCMTTVYNQGEGTYYNLLEQGSVGNCTFVNDSVKPYYGALATGMYNGAGGAEPAKFCGTCVEMTGPAGTEIVQIVDQCPTCHLDQDIDLSPQAFEAIIGPLSVGRAGIEWFEVACPWGNKPLDVIIQGSNPWYGKVIIAGHKNRINKVEILNGSVWEEMVRGEDNGWVKGGLGGHSSYEIRVTDIFGEEVIVSGVDLNVADGRVKGTSNFTPCWVTSEEEINSFDYISAFPNPTTSNITFEGIQKVDQIQIINMLGEVVFSESLNGVTSKVSLDVSQFKSGIYLTNFYTQGQKATSKTFVKK